MTVASTIQILIENPSGLLNSGYGHNWYQSTKYRKNASEKYRNSFLNELLSPLF